jgi:ferredoxin
LSNMPIIDVKKCNGCGICVSVCACKALVMVNNVVTYIKPEPYKECNRWCAQCELACPQGAITCPFEIVIEDQP